MTGVQTCALPICETAFRGAAGFREARRDAVPTYREMWCSAAVQAARYCGTGAAVLLGGGWSGSSSLSFCA